MPSLLSSPVRRPTARLSLWLCFAVGWAAAQQLSVSPTELAAGESVSVESSGLPPGSQVTVQLTTPGGKSREGVRVGEAGRFGLETPLRVVGGYQLMVRGQGLDETRILEVRPAKAQRPPEQLVPPDPAPLDPPQTDSPPTEAESAPPAVRRVEGGLQATQGGALHWRLTFPAGSGATTEPVFAGEQLFVGHGNSVLRLEPRTGNVLERAIVSGPVERLEALDDATLTVTVRHGEELTERFTLRDGRVQEPVRFGAAPATFGYLRAEANVRDPAARLKRDPTNPWLHLALGLRKDSEGAQAHFTEAIATATTFYDLAGLATALEGRGERPLAADAFDAAMQDFAARGYDPRLLTNAGLEAAYHFPLTPLKAALEGRGDRSAGFWAERLVLAAPNVPGADAALNDYAALLRATGSPEDTEWARRADRSTLAAPDLPERVAVVLGRSGWGFALALLGAFAALQLTLFAKYALARRADRGDGGRAPWLFAVRYTTLSEKIVSLLLLASVLACSALAGWQDAADPPPPALASGTLLSYPAQAFLEDAKLNGPASTFIRGYSAQISGDEAAARTLLVRAGDYAPALNNLGVLTGNDDLYRRALSLLPTLTAARYNLGDAAERNALLPFAARYQPGPALAVPTTQTVQTAITGSWQTALARATTPQRLSAPPAVTTTPRLALWRTAQLLFFLVVLVILVSLFIPRPRSVHGAPRPWAYELLALLVPGSGSADEAWGIFLLVPWAVFGAAALSPRFSWGTELGLTPLTLLLVLGGIYLLNAVAVAVEWQAHRSRRRALARRTRSRRA